MEHILLFILFFTGFVSFVPVLQMNRSTTDNKYRCLKYLINTAFVWTVFIFSERLFSSTFIIYYAHMLGYPIKFLLASFMVCAIFNYIEKPMPKSIAYAFGVVAVAEFVIALSNNVTQLYLATTYQNISTFADLYSAAHGPLFILHMVISYVILLGGIVYLFYFLATHQDVRQYRSITRTMAVNIIIVLIVNALQIFVIKSDVDLTYVSIIIVVYGLYIAIYKKDMVFNLKSSGRGEILSNMRELYILTDSEHHVVEVSDLLMEKYHLVKENYIGKHLDLLTDELQKQMVFYSEYDVDRDEKPNVDHYHMREKKFTLKGMKDYGYMILLYDETQVFELLRELNRLSNYDNMTGLHNRNFIERKIEEIKTLGHVGIVSMDLNGLKVNNDYLGHKRGDYLLKELARHLKDVMSNYETKYMARIGGDEFLIIVPDTTEEVIATIQQQILEECKNENIEHHVSVSIGTAYSKEEINLFTLLQEADQNMYRMKQQSSSEYKNSIIEFAHKTGQYIR